MNQADALIEATILDDDPIEGHFAVHDSTHVEIKLDYSIESPNAVRYRVDTYFFIPKSLGLTSHTYDGDDFYGDVQGYIRFKSPQVPLAELIDPESARSPLPRIKEEIKLLRRDPRSASHRLKISNELRLFGCIARNDIRNRASALRERLGALGQALEVVALRQEDASAMLERLVEEIRPVFDEWRQLRPDFLDGRLPTPIVETYSYVDEYLSLHTELTLAALVRRIDRLNDISDELRTARDAARDLLVEERRHREAADYVPITPNQKDEHLVFHKGRLKKFVTSVLWLDISKVKEGRGAQNFGAAIAAGAAMLFAVISTIYQTQRWGVNSWTFVIAAVITYMLKDRIKDWLKNFFGSRFSRWIPDQSVRIVDPGSRTAIGRCKETVRHLSLEKVPSEIRQLRHNTDQASIEVLSKPEVILHYQKSIRLSQKQLAGISRLESENLHDIIRFSMNRFVGRCDDETSAMPYFDEDLDKVTKKRYRKVYHLNMVMVLSSIGHGTKQTRRVRVIFDKKGIRRLELVEA